MKDIKNMTPEELDAYRYEHRFDEAEAVMGKEAADALRKLYDFYGKDWLYWLASLYDAKRGAFYFNDSARDNPQFLPDVESTCQAINMIGYLGALDYYNGVSVDAFPKDMQKNCVKFVQNMQCNDDGYFYHEQWGKDIGYNRRNRDFNQSLSLLGRFGANPLYPTALDRLKNDTAKQNSESSMPEHLLSKEAMKKFLDELDINHNSYRTGHAISSQVNQITAAGLADFVIDYINEHQYADTGLWEEEANYDTLSGVIKLSGALSGLGSYLHRADKLVESTISVILSDETPGFICHVFNPWGAFSSVINGLQKSDKKLDFTAEDVRAMIYKRLPELVDKTIEKFAEFKKPGGTFSHYQDRSTPTAQGSPISLGGYEGDVNSLACAMHYPLNGIFGVLGIKKIPMINNDDFQKFRAIIESAHKSI